MSESAANAVEAAKLARRVKQLEKKVATLSVLNGALREENDELSDKLKSAGSQNGGGGAGQRQRGAPSASQAQEIEEITEEFAQRLGKIEDKLLDVTEQRDDLRAELKEAREEAAAKESRLADREDAIASLQSEGDELARKIGSLEGTVKKLKGSLREETAERERLESQVEAMKRDFKMDGAGAGANGDGPEGAGGRVKVLSEELEEERAKYASMSESLKSQYDGKLEEYKRQLEDQHKHDVMVLKEREYKLSDQVQRLQDSLVELEGSSAEREDSIRKESRFLEHKCQQLETKLAEAANSYAEQSQPYIEEIDHLREECARESQRADGVAAEFRGRVKERENQIRVLEGKLLASETIAMSTEEVMIKLKETVADTNRQLEQQHQRVIDALKKAASAEGEAKDLREREQSLLQELDKKEVDFQDRLRDSRRQFQDQLKARESELDESRRSSEQERAESKADGNGEASEGREDDLGGHSMGLEDLLKDSGAKLNWNLLQGGQRRDEAGEVRSLKERLRGAEQERDEALEVIERMEGDLGELRRRDAVSLTLIGEGEEKAERLQEEVQFLKTDLADLKELYRQHIVEHIPGQDFT